MATRKQYKFSAMTAEQSDKQNIENFYSYFNTVWISKEPFIVELNSKEVELHLFIERMDMSEYIEHCNTQEVVMGIIPSFNSLSEKYKNEILNQYTADKKEYMKVSPILLLPDILFYGLNIPLYTEATEDANKTDYLIKSAMAVSSGVTNLIGFNLDKTFNIIGNTGWDLLSSYCEDQMILKER